MAWCTMLCVHKVILGRCLDLVYTYGSLKSLVVVVSIVCMYIHTESDILIIAQSGIAERKGWLPMLQSCQLLSGAGGSVHEVFILFYLWTHGRWQLCDQCTGKVHFW